MSDDLVIRPSHAADGAAIKRLYRDAFPHEDLGPLVADLLAQPAGVLSLVASRDAAIAGHVVFSTCSVDGCRSALALLGPLAVGNAHQKRGHGSALIRAGLDRLAADAFGCVFVLGDPGYYARFGFAADTLVLPPYPLDAKFRAAWQSLPLGSQDFSCSGRLSVPAPWQRPALWSP